MERYNTFRSRLIKRVERYLLRHSLPRFQMFVIVLATGAFGFLFSFLLLKAGWEKMWQRYPLAVGLAYLVFFILLRIWLAYQKVITSAPTGRREKGETLEGLGDLIEGSVDVYGSIPSSGGSGGADFDACIDFDAWFLVIIAVIAVTGALFASLYVVYSAPSLLAEVFVDGIIVSRFYKRLKKNEQQHWVYGAIQHTWLPALAVAVLLGFAGYVLQWAAPEACSIGSVWKHFATK